MLEIHRSLSVNILYENYLQILCCFPPSECWPMPHAQIICQSRILRPWKLMTRNNKFLQNLRTIQSRGSNTKSHIFLIIILWMNLAWLAKMRVVSFNNCKTSHQTLPIYSELSVELNAWDTVCAAWKMNNNNNTCTVLTSDKPNKNLISHASTDSPLCLTINITTTIHELCALHANDKLTYSILSTLTFNKLIET